MSFHFDHRDESTKLIGKETLAGERGGVAGLVGNIAQRAALHAPGFQKILDDEMEPKCDLLSRSSCSALNCSLSFLSSDSRFESSNTFSITTLCCSRCSLRDGVIAFASGALLCRADPDALGPDSPHPSSIRRSIPGKQTGPSKVIAGCSLRSFSPARKATAWLRFLPIMQNT